MKYLKFDVGGRPVALDDFDVLQDEVYAALQATLQEAPPMVLSGCRVLNSVFTNGVTRADIEPGMVWLAGNVQRYDGASQVQLPAEIVAGPYVDSDERAYQTGGTKACMTERELLTQPVGTAAPGTALRFYTNAELSYYKYVESRTRSIGEVQWLARYTAIFYDSTGLGYIDRDTRGWALCNGQNGTADLRERFIVGMSPANQEYSAPGRVGGTAAVRLEIDNMPAHTHPMQAAGEHRHAVPSRGGTGGATTTRRGDQAGSDVDVPTSSSGTHTHIIDEVGRNQAHENRPPYYTLVAREWIGF